MRGERGKGKTAVAVSLSEKLLKEADKRAKELDITRSQYLRMLIQADLGATFPKGRGK
jgi:metal-responsive CopG/Arc/MetJ family transcriptional regulator